MILRRHVNMEKQKKVREHLHPLGTKKRKPYVRPGSFGCGIASKATKPTAATQYGMNMKGQRFCLRSLHSATTIVATHATM